MRLFKEMGKQSNKDCTSLYWGVDYEVVWERITGNKLKEYIYPSDIDSLLKGLHLYDVKDLEFIKTKIEYSHKKSNENWKPLKNYFATFVLISTFVYGGDAFNYFFEGPNLSKIKALIGLSLLVSFFIIGYNNSFDKPSKKNERKLQMEFVLNKYINLVILEKQKGRSNNLI